MTNTRRVVVEIIYMGANITTDLAPNLVSFTWNDNEGKSDDVQITIEDRDRKWQGPWLPGRGDTLQASIKLLNWQSEGDDRKLNCGTFYVDDVQFKRPPDIVTIKAMSVPFNSGGKETEHTRSWENSTLAAILGEVSGSSGLALVYDAPNYSYDRVDQLRETDLSFAKRVAKKEGLSIKVADNQLVAYDELSYESKGPVKTITRGDTDVISYSFNETSAEEQYKTVEVSYFDDTKKKTFKYTYNVPGVSEGPILRINKRAKSVEEAQRWAKAEARNKNKGAKTGKITVMGDESLMQGVTVTISNFGKFDTKYFIESASHKVTGGYTTDINIREALSY